MAYETLLLDVRDAVAFVTVNRPEKRNDLAARALSARGQAAFHRCVGR